MRIAIVAATAGAALLFALAGTGAQAQTIHVVRPAHGAIVRETVQVKVAPSDLPPDGYVAIYIDGTFRVAQTLPANSDDPVYVWDTKSPAPGGTEGPADGDHTLRVDIFSSTSKLLGTDTVPVRVANQIAPPSPALKLTYHWTTQHKLTYHRVAAMTVPGDQPDPTGGASADAGAGTPPDQDLQSADLAFARTTENASAAQTVLRDIVISGTVTSHGQSQTILSSYNIQPQLKTVNARGAVLSRVSEDDLMDHIGFPVPELPIRRVGKGDRWQEPVAVPLNWDESTRADVTAECSLEGFEWQNNYPTAKIRETYSGPARFTSQTSTVSGHGSLPPISASNITYNRVIYFAYGAGRVIKETTKTQITLTTAQLTLLGGTAPASVLSPPTLNYPGGPNPGVNNQSFGGGATLRLMSDPIGPQYAQFGGPPQGYPGSASPFGEPVRTSFLLLVTATNTLQTP